MIDSIILGAMGSVFTGLWWAWEPSGHSGVGTLFVWLCFAGMESSSYQATVGKMVLGIRVTDLNGQRITFFRATGRYFAKILSALILMVGFLMAGFTQRKQALHDMLAETLVVSRN